MTESMQGIEFVLKKNTDIERVFSTLCQEYSLHETFRMQLNRHYLDSFDWRMYQKNYICGFDTRHNPRNKGGEGHFFIHERETGNCVCEFPLEHFPRFAKEVAHQACRKRLDDILGIRALMTVATLTIKRRQLLVLNKENKTLVILQAESYALDGQSGEKQLPDRLIVFPIRGYKKVFKQVLHYITRHLKLPCADGMLFEAVLAATDRKPDPDALSLDCTLNDSLNTWEAAQILLRHLLKVMQANEPGLRAAIDTEFLHDYRVAVRRIRSILGQIRHILPKQQLDYFKREFYWLGTVTTPTRDLDMYLLKFDSYMQELPADVRHDLAPFRLFLERHWKVEHARLCRALDSKRYRKLIHAWQQILENKTIQSQPLIQEALAQETVNAARPAREVANQRIWKLYKRVLKEGMAISPESPEEDLHELRKSCKKFRYLIEFFHDYYPDKQIRKLVKSLKDLQDNLGDFQDLCVQTVQLNRFAQQMQQEGLADTRTIMAMGVLVEKLNAHKAAVRAEFAQCFRAFTLPDTKAAFVDALSPPYQPEGMTV